MQRILDAMEINDLDSIKLLILRFGFNNAKNCLDLDSIKSLILQFGFSNLKNCLDSALHRASFDGHSDIAEYLLSLGCCANIALIGASHSGLFNIVKYSISVGADVKCYNNVAFYSACIEGHLDIVKYLYECGADVKCYNKFAICEASRIGHLDIVEYLVMMGVDVNKIDSDKAKELCFYSFYGGDFDYAYKLSKYHCFEHTAVKKTLDKIHNNRKNFIDNIKKNKFANIFVVTQNAKQYFQ